MPENSGAVQLRPNFLAWKLHGKINVKKDCYWLVMYAIINHLKQKQEILKMTNFKNATKIIPALIVSNSSFVASLISTRDQLIYSAKDCTMYCSMSYFEAIINPATFMPVYDDIEPDFLGDEIDFSELSIVSVEYMEEEIC